ncbi:Putative voltage-gated potassium channel subunit beta [Psilocybe cubensis]|uniref:Voltage-gated potassium channel subunit beta n=1 Tax=Psilocybe cubensis TaxID=181762 RepID=A0ACB8HEI1_PSICU|nr:Putative voltage-gated potassium channel subunit beta [Psilocybe cubensis]KAH9486135.1 Putative voltage-gated potassium channel subunit beta [Psilocybe cubensis]
MATPLQDWPVQREYDPKGMPFRRLGPSGLRVPVFSFGGWLTLGGSLDKDATKELIKTAFEAGINMFDTSENYANGKCEEVLGYSIRELGLRRSDLVISTKLFWGVGRKSPNDGGLTRKQPDPHVSMEETVRAFNYVIEQGWAFYWGTSEWGAREIEEAHHIAAKLHLIGPIAEQCQHNMLTRERPEKEYAALYKKYHMSTTVFSPLQFGVLTGKYLDGIPADSRLSTSAHELDWLFKELESPQGKQNMLKVKELMKFAQEELQTNLATLALAWVARNPNTATVILGASKSSQITDNIKALELIPKLTPEVLHKLDKILDNAPEALPSYGRPLLDRFGRI